MEINSMWNSNSCDTRVKQKSIVKPQLNLF